ncbi:MAG: PEGA domain-containing protein [Planctomycetes bacterium]|nr:PEGA domain-containing protein [Planctomycetota bacterium]
MVKLLVLALLLGATGCRTRRYLEITSSPPGAEVRLDDEAVGRTPLKVPFEHYGTRRITYYLAGYRSYSRRVRLKPPWHARFPIDIVTEVLLPLGLTDRRAVHQDLVQGAEVMSLPSLRSVIERADVLRQSGPEGPRDLPEVAPAVVPSEAEPAPEEPAPHDPVPPEPAPRTS